MDFADKFFLFIARAVVYSFLLKRGFSNGFYRARKRLVKGFFSALIFLIGGLVFNLQAQTEIAKKIEVDGQTIARQSIARLASAETSADRRSVPQFPNFSSPARSNSILKKRKWQRLWLAAESRMSFSVSAITSKKARYWRSFPVRNWRRCTAKCTKQKRATNSRREIWRVFKNRKIASPSCSRKPNSTKPTRH